MPRPHHSELVRRGLRFQDRFQYAKALPFFVEAHAQWPTCPNAIYNLANSLHMNDRSVEACVLLRELVAATDEQLLHGCDDLAGTPRSLRVDAWYLLFQATLEAQGDWGKAVPFLHRHLRGRARGLRSLWSKAQVLAEAEAMRREHAPRARPVSEWA